MGTIEVLPSKRGSPINVESTNKGGDTFGVPSTNTSGIMTPCSKLKFHSIASTSSSSIIPSPLQSA